MKPSLEHIYLCLSSIPHIGPVTFKQLIEHFGSARKIYLANKKQLSEILGQKRSQEFIKIRSLFKTDSILQDLFNKDVRYITFESSLFPLSLRTIPDSPIGIFTKGDISLLSKTSPKIAIVGTRRPTSYGKHCTEHIVSELKLAESIIISGMALGIDGLAHRRALEQNLSTIAVLGSPIDIAYPREHSQLYNEISKKGLIISEYPPNAVTHKGSFPTRNRIISALSDRIIIIEGTRTSGTLITARYAAEQGREVFALPGNITSHLSEAPNSLILQGAHPVVSLNDICEQLGIKVLGLKETYSNLPEDIAEVIKIISSEPTSPEDLVKKTRRPIYEVLTILSELEIQGVVSKNDLGEYYPRS